MDENVKNHQVNDEQLEGVCGGVSANIIDNLPNTASEQASVQSINVCGNNTQPASGRIRDTKISDVMTETEMKQAGEETLKRALRF
ncbi:MAG: hypothetical protein ACI4K7_11060 [Oscillospiraceae bacterium]